MQANELILKTAVYLATIGKNQEQAAQCMGMHNNSLARHLRAHNTSWKRITYGLMPVSRLADILESEIRKPYTSHKKV